MTIQVTVPNMGESVIEATIARWMKQEGEPVKAGEPIVELETDKINLEVGAQQAGVLKRIEKQAGDTVEVGDVLALVEEGADSGAGNGAGNATATGQQPVSDAQVAADAQDEPVQPNAGQGGENMEAALKQAATSESTGQVTPIARRMAADLGVDLTQVTPSGTGGRITKQDVEAYVQKAGEKPAAPQKQAAEQRPVAAPQKPPPQPTRAEPPAAAEGRAVERIRMSRRRQTIARRLVEAQQNAAMLTTFNEIDMQAVIDLRKRRRAAFKDRYGVDLGFMPFFIKAVIGGLKAFPYLNAELQGDEILLKHYYDIGIAVGAEEGLVVPVIRSADRLSFAEIEEAIGDFVERSRNGQLTLDDLRGGSFTITNGGVYGSLLSTPILNPPQVGILGMHRFQQRPVVVDGEIVARPMMYVALSYDHRIVDGREAVQFLVRVKELVEDPEELLFS